VPASRLRRRMDETAPSRPEQELLLPRLSLGKRVSVGRLPQRSRHEGGHRAEQADQQHYGEPRWRDDGHLEDHHAEADQGHGQQPGEADPSEHAPAHLGTPVGLANPGDGSRHGVGGGGGAPSSVEAIRAVAALVSAAKPRTGRSRVIRSPIVRTMRRPPAYVPRAMDVWASRTTHNGTAILLPDAERWWVVIRMAAITPMVVWASLPPWPRLTAAEDTSCACGSGVGLLDVPSGEDRPEEGHEAHTPMPGKGLTTMKRAVLVTFGSEMADQLPAPPK
jgi:hypothetical protein